MDHHFRRRLKKATKYNTRRGETPFWATTGMRQNHFAVIAAPKVPAPVLTPRKCEDEETKSRRREKEENEKRLLKRKRERSYGQAARRGARVLRQEAVIALLT